MTGRPRGRRPAGGPDARVAIVASARRLFAEVGFERASMRAIAADAGVDVALIYHHVGTKEDLLAAVLAPPVDPARLLDGVDADPRRTGEELVRRVLEVWDGDSQSRQAMVGLLRVGLSNDHAADALRDALGSTILAAVQRVVARDRASLRAALIGSQIGGLLLGRYIVGIPALRDASPATLAAAIGPVIQHYLVGSLEPAEPFGGLTRGAMAAS